MNLLKIILTVSCLFILSCNDNTEDVITDVNVNKLADGKAKKKLITSHRRNYNVTFKKRLDWTSFITARVIGGYNSLALNELKTKLNGRNKISLRELIGPKVPNTSPFKLAFINILSQNIMIDLSPKAPGPVHSNQQPPRPITVNSDNGGSVIQDTPLALSPSIFDDPTPTVSLESLVNSFLNGITVSNCVELYFPKGLTLSAQNRLNSVVSTGHPLNNDLFNIGYLQFHQYTPEEITQISDFLQSSSIYIDANFLSNTTFNNIIVARPYRNNKLVLPNEGHILNEGISTNSCSYSQYTIDFTTFLKK